MLLDMFFFAFLVSSLASIKKVNHHHRHPHRYPPNIHQVDLLAVRGFEDEPSALSLLDVITSNGSDIERRIRSFEKQVNAKRIEVEKMKKQKNKEALKLQEDQLRKQLQVGSSIQLCFSR